MGIATFLEKVKEKNRFAIIDNINKYKLEEKKIMKIGIDIDGVILDYERVLKTYGDLYDFIELKKDGIINRNEHYLRNRYDWTDEERMNFINKYFLKLSEKTPLIPGAKDVIDMLQKEGNELIIISARGGMIEKMKDVAIEKFKEEDISFNKYYWKQDDKLEVAQNENLKEVSNWGEIYRYIKEMQSK